MLCFAYFVCVINGIPVMRGTMHEEDVTEHMTKTGCLSIAEPLMQTDCDNQIPLYI